MKSLKDTSYRQYLSDIFKMEKESRRTVSLRDFSDRLGFNESTFRMILSGERNLTVHNIHIIGQKLKFSIAQMEVFEALVLRDQAESDEERKYYSRRLQESSSRYALTDFKITEESILKKWYGPALLVYLRENQLTKETLSSAELRSLAQKLGVKLDEVITILEVLDGAGLLSVNSGKKEHFILDKVTSANAQAVYIKNCFSIALDKIDKDYKTGKSLFSVKCLSIDDEKISDFANDYKSLLEKYMAVAGESQRAQILQVTFGAIRVL